MGLRVVVMLLFAVAGVVWPVQAVGPFLAADRVSNANIVIVRDSEATEAFRPIPTRVRQMVDQGIVSLTGKSSVAEAWRSIATTNGVLPTNAVFGIKVCSTPAPNGGTHPAVAAAVIEGLIAAGIRTNQIIIWDKLSTDLRLAGFYDLADRYNVRVAGSVQAGYDETEAYSTSPIIGNLVWGDLEFGRKGPGIGRKSFVSKLVSQEMTRIINISPLLNHNRAGVVGSLYGLTAASVDNFGRFEMDAERLATAVPEIYAMPVLGDRVALNIVDALMCQYEGSERGLLHYSAVLNQLRFSRDPVALDVLSLQELERQRLAVKAPEPNPNHELYSNASLLELGVSDLKKIHIVEASIPAH
jgi:hypothetical protein